MKKNKLALNTLTSIGLQATTIICGIILPRLILTSYGTAVNGLTASITQFLSIISFLELGVGAVVQSALYEPLLKEDNKRISQIVSSAQKYFRVIAKVLIVYVLILIVFYPIVIEQKFDHLYSAMLIIVISISSFAQYYLGIVDRLLLTADQKGYIQYVTQIFTLILNILFCMIFIYFGAGIHIVKLTTSFLFVIRPILIRVYINKHYSINCRERYDSEPIKQKWNGVAQHVSAVVLDGTDVIVLTLFSTLENVSIYSVYFMVINGIKQLFVVSTNAIQAFIGELWAKKEIGRVRIVFSHLEWLIHAGVTFVFGCTLVLIVPFIQVYTNGVSDANYTVPLFAALIVIANALHCLRLPYYDVLIKACNDYKNTQNNFALTAVINVLISIILVRWFGLIGVAIGTIVAMTFQTVWTAVYASRKIINRSYSYFIKHIFADVISDSIACFLSHKIVLQQITYVCWIVMAFKVAVIFLLVIIIVNILLYREEVMYFLNKFRTKKRRIGR